MRIENDCSSKLKYHAPKLEVFGTMQQLTAAEVTDDTDPDGGEAGWGTAPLS